MYACASQGHGTDVNVISWNHLVNYLVVSGADDGSMRIWDLRSLSSGQPVARFHWHKAPITSVEWSPHESSTIAASAADDQLSLWDLALEVHGDRAEIAPRSRRDRTEIAPRSRRDRAPHRPLLRSCIARRETGARRLRNMSRDRAKIARLIGHCCVLVPRGGR